MNLASRLEGLTKIFAANIIISENVLKEVEDEIELDYRFLGKVQVKGKNIMVAIYDVFSYDPKPIKTIKLQIKESFESAINLYQSDNFLEAKKIFKSVLEIYPEDLASQYYLDLIKDKLEEKS